MLEIRETSEKEIVIHLHENVFFFKYLHEIDLKLIRIISWVGVHTSGNCQKFKITNCCFVSHHSNFFLIIVQVYIISNRQIKRPFTVSCEAAS